MENYKKEGEIMNEEQIGRRSETRDKVLLFVIGVLVGAVVSTGVFFAYIKITGIGSVSDQSMQMPGGTPPEMSSGGNGQPPEMPSGENGQPPEMPSGTSGQTGQGQSSGNNGNS